ncbi:MAG TPA: YaaC family protein [Bacillales bacterium]|nr:YaaC family protein [Bacillales bacterium]
MAENRWNRLSPFQTVSYTKPFLHRAYANSNVENPEKQSYRNSYPFLYYLQHGKKHYELAGKAPVELRPLLLFYGFTQLIKACLLTVDPDYPKTTSVLAHGVSTRKKKKKNYRFFTDEVRIQKFGLVTHFAEQLFGRKNLDGIKFSMRDLLERIPDLNDLFTDLDFEAPFYLLTKENDGKRMTLSNAILDDLHMTGHRFVEFLNRKRFGPAAFGAETKKTIALHVEGSIACPTSLSNRKYLPRKKTHYDGLPEMVVHCLLLYNLSMICRYETEWWNELFHHASAEELPFITSFLDVTEKKIPLLVERYLRSLM